MSEENVVVFVGKCDEWWKLKYNTVIQELFNNSLEKIIHFFKQLYKIRRGDEEKHFLKPFFFGGGKGRGDTNGFLVFKIVSENTVCNASVWLSLTHVLWIFSINVNFGLGKTLRSVYWDVCSVCSKCKILQNSH